MRKLDARGFTLLELMIAMTIMLLAFSSILAIQSSSVSSALRARQTHEVSMLARSALAQTEVEISGKKFNEISEEISGQFEEPYQDYSWKREIKEITLPNLAGIASATQGENAQSDEETEAQKSAMVEQMTKVVTNFLSKAVREVVITVSWKRGITTQTYEVAMYWVDLDSELQINP